MTEMLSKSTASAQSAQGSGAKTANMSAQNAAAVQSMAKTAAQGQQTAAAGAITVGSRVRITGTAYPNGQTIAEFARQKTHTVSQVRNDQALLKEIVSWVAIKDLVALSAAELSDESSLSDAKAAASAAGLKGAVDDQKAMLARYNPDESLFDNAARAVLAVETAGDAGKTGDIGDNAGLSVGGFQITEKYSLYKLVAKYADMGGTVSIPSQIVDGLKKSDATNLLYLSSEERNTLKNLLIRAYNEDRERYLSAQKLIWKANYFDGCTERMKRFGLNPDTLDPKIAILIYDHENSGSGNNNQTLQIMADNFGDGKTIDQSKLTLENVAWAIQQQFASRNNGTYINGWNSRVISLYAGLKMSPASAAAATAAQTAVAQESPETAAQTVAAPESAGAAPSATQTASGEIAAGSRVKIVGTNYATGQIIPDWVKARAYTVRRIDAQNRRALIDEITSWVFIADLRPIEAQAAPVQSPAQTGGEQTSARTAPAQQTESPSETTISALLKANPSVKTNQDLINLFYRMSDNTYSGAANEAQKYGIKMSALTNNRSAAVAGGAENSAQTQKQPENAQSPAASAQSSQSPAQTPQKPAQTAQTPFEKLLADNADKIRTNQDLINYFINSLGDGTYGSGAAKAREYGVDMNALTADRSAQVSGAAATQTPTASASGGGVAVSTNGVPLFKQSDSRWGSNHLGRNSTIAKVGCAMTSTAMVLSKLAGRTIYPDALNTYLNNNGGYDGNCIYWSKAAQYIGKSYTGRNYTQTVVDDELNNGRPMVISVNNAGHWVCVAGRQADGNYIIHDPGYGDVRTAKWNGNVLAVNGYSEGDDLRTFG